MMNHHTLKGLLNSDENLINIQKLLIGVNFSGDYLSEPIVPIQQLNITNLDSQDEQYC